MWRSDKMKFKNETGEMVILRKDIKTEDGRIIDYHFYDCENGDVVDISEAHGNNLGFARVDVKVKKPIDEVEEVIEEIEEIEEDNSDYEETLKNIKGVGKKTVEDILTVFDTEKKLRTAIKNEEELPFRNDVVNKLIRVFGE